MFNMQKDNRVIDEETENPENTRRIVKELLIQTKRELGEMMCLLVRYLRASGLTVEENLRESLAELARDRSLEAWALLLLERIDQQSYSEAKKLINDINAEEWEVVADEWYSSWILNNSLDAAIICGIAAVVSQSTRLETDKHKITAIIRSERPEVADFLDELRAD